MAECRGREEEGLFKARGGNRDRRGERRGEEAERDVSPNTGRGREIGHLIIEFQSFRFTPLTHQIHTPHTYICAHACVVCEGGCTHPSCGIARFRCRGAQQFVWEECVLGHIRTPHALRRTQNRH